MKNVENLKEKNKMCLKTKELSHKLDIRNPILQQILEILKKK